MTTENARTSPSFAPASRIAAVGLLAGVLAFLLATPTDASAQTTERVSVDSAGTQGNGSSILAAISADGRFVAFSSDASNLVPGDTNEVSDVFVYDRQTRTIERVSVDSSGNEGNGGSLLPAISADGRFVVFQSDATNLVPADTNGVSDVFVYDRQTRTTERVSVDSAETQANSFSYFPALSADGRFVAFASYATNLVAGDTNEGWDVFVHDRQARSTERVSMDSAGNQGNGWSQNPAISADGRFVAFNSSSTNLVPADTNGVYDTFVHDRQTGTTERVSVDSAGTEWNGSSDRRPVISADGRVVAFASYANNLAFLDVFVHDRQTRTTERLSADNPDVQGRYAPSISADGRFVAFVSPARIWSPGDRGSFRFVFVHDRSTGITERVSVNSAGIEGNGSLRPAISADGRFIAFESGDSDLVPGDTNGLSDVFVRDYDPDAAQQDITPPVQTNGRPMGTLPAGTTSAMLRLTTNERATCRHSAAPGVAYGAMTATFDFTGGTGHATPVGGLSDGGSYRFYVRCADFLGNVNVDDFIIAFSVASPPPTPSDATPPVRSNGQPSGTQPAGTTQATLSLVTNEGATCRYSTTPGPAYGAMTDTFASTGGTGHATPVGGLSDGGSYTFYVRCQDTAGNANPDDYPIAFNVATRVTFDTPPPAGTLTLSDDAGQTLSQGVATGSMPLVTTGWTRPATTVTVSFTMGWSLGG
jgi:Tol biopolymer transport system component